uniref:Secreted protein n=1 Tax=Gopherus agassizii TaxID=38772 RepID=A0A452GU18_9SAUR
MGPVVLGGPFRVLVGVLWGSHLGWSDCSPGSEPLSLGWTPLGGHCWVWGCLRGWILAEPCDPLGRMHHSSVSPFSPSSLFSFPFPVPLRFRPPRPAPRRQLHHHHRRRFQNPDRGDQRRAGQAADLGHGGTGAIPHHHLHVLPQHPRRHHRLRCDEPRILRQHQALAARDWAEL